MRVTQNTAVFCLLALILTAPATAATSEEKRVADATDVLDKLLRIPEQAIPPTLLSRAYAVAVIPDVIKVGFGIGVRHGKGILVIRQDDNSWSNPVFIALTGGSVGWQIGGQSTDIILVFKTRKGVDGIANGKITLGADASIAAGPVGRQASAATDIVFQAEIMSYSRSRGLFAGISFEGTGVTMDRKSNVAFYGDSTMTPERIFASSPNIAPDVANTFVQMLTAQTSRLPTQPGMRSGVTSISPPYSDDTASVRTFGMPDPDEDLSVPDDENFDPDL
ncbi:MAG: lipid-binding SYLF domain-containing protein [Proteobacteria bacterium]|nr:lipid-binding SYLF domain-containing protein [Pseudomonadota bacterium]